MREYSDSQLANVERTQRSSSLDPHLPVSSLLAVETVQVPLKARTKRSVFECLVEVAGRTWKIWEPSAVLKAVQEREELMSTAFDQGMAIPHPRHPLPDSLEDSVLAFGRTLGGIPCGAPNNSLTDLFFLVVCRDSRTHLHVLARLGRMFQRPDFLQQLREATNSQDTYDIIVAEDEHIG